MLERLIGISSKEVLQLKNNPMNCAPLKEKIEKVFTTVLPLLNSKLIPYTFCIVFRELKGRIENCICSEGK